MLPKRIDDRAAFHNSTADEFLARDEELVFEARTLLGLLDFEFFRVAWRNWHGGEPDDRRLEPGFVTFLFKQLAPDYVRHFARLVLRQAAAGQFDPAAFGVAAEPEVVPASICLRDEFASSSFRVVMGLLLIIAF